MKNLLPVILLSIYLPTFSQNWMRIYGDSSFTTRTVSVKEVYDKGYLLTGGMLKNSTNFGWTIKTDINGFEIWSKEFGNDGLVYDFVSSAPTTDGGFVFAGGTNRLNQNCNYPFIIKVNSCGEKQWCKLFHSPNCLTSSNGIVAYSDTAYIMLVQNWAAGLYENVWLFRLNEDGDVVWTKNYLTDQSRFWSPYARSLAKTPDNCVLITGDAYTPDSLTPGYFIDKIFNAKVDINGTSLFESPWGDDNGIISINYFNPPVFDYNNFIYISGGRNRTTVPYGYSPCLFKTSGSGQPVSYSDLIQDSYNGLASPISWFNDTTMFICASWSMSTTGNDTTAIFKVKPDGIKLKSKLLFTNTNTMMNGSCSTFDNKVLTTGNAGNTGLGRTYLFKFNSDLEYDSVYTRHFTYDSLCPHPILSDTVSMDDCAVVQSVYDYQKEPEKSKLIIYPDPAKEFVTIELPQYLVRQSKGYGITATTAYQQWNGALLEIYDIFGRLQFSEIVNQSTKTVKPDITSWHAGIYVARLVFQKETVAREKFIIEK